MKKKLGSDCAFTSIVACALVALMTAGALAESAPPAASASKMTLHKGDRLVLCGDSITAMCKYSVLVDLYLAGCRPDLEVSLYQDAISGENTAMFLTRLDGTLARTKPTVMTSFYGWNDGGWVAFKEENGAKYEAGTRKLIKRVADAKVRLLLVSPGMAGPKLENADVYNETLGKIRDIGRRVAAETGTPFLDLHEPMVVAQQKMRAREGANYDIVGNDGAHADWQGHMAMAVAFLRGLGLGDEPLARIELDASTGKATASEGHRIISSDAKTITVESSRYAYFFHWQNPGVDLHDMPKVAEELGFFDDLNRYILVVNNLPAGNYEVTWDKVSATFTAAQLAAGVNLAHAFQRTPFDAVMYELWQLSLGKCNADKVMTVDAVHNRKELAGLDKQIASVMPEEAAKVDLAALIQNDPMKIHEMFVQRQRTVAKPVTYQISVVAK